MVLHSWLTVSHEELDAPTIEGNADVAYVRNRVWLDSEAVRGVEVGEQVTHLDLAPHVFACVHGQHPVLVARFQNYCTFRAEHILRKPRSKARLFRVFLITKAS